MEDQSSNRTKRKQKKRKSSTLKNLGLLTCAAFCNFGNFYNARIPEKLVFPVAHRFYQGTTELESLSRTFNLITIPSSIIAGFLITKFKVSNISMVGSYLTFVSTAGAIIALYMKSWRVFYLSRLLHAVFFPSLCISQILILAQNFKRTDLTIFTCLGQAVSVSALIFSNWVGPGLYEETEQLETSFAFGCLVSLIGVLFLIIFWLLQNRNQRQIPRGDPLRGKLGICELSLLNDLDLSFWVICLIFGANLLIFSGYEDFYKTSLFKLYGYTISEAQQSFDWTLKLGFGSGIVYSLLAKKFGKIRILAFPVSSFLSTTAWWMLGSVTGTEKWVFSVIPLIFGQIFGLINFALWSCLALNLRRRARAVGFGVAFSIAAAYKLLKDTLLEGSVIRDGSEAYHKEVRFLFWLSVLSTIAGLYLYYLDGSKADQGCGMLGMADSDPELEKVLRRRESLMSDTYSDIELTRARNK